MNKLCEKCWCLSFVDGSCCCEQDCDKRIFECAKCFDHIILPKSFKGMHCKKCREQYRSFRIDVGLFSCLNGCKDFESITSFDVIKQTRCPDCHWFVAYRHECGALAYKYKKNYNFTCISCCETIKNSEDVFHWSPLENYNKLTNDLCTQCGEPCLTLLNSVECSNRQCINFYG